MVKVLALFGILANLCSKSVWSVLGRRGRKGSCSSYVLAKVREKGPFCTVAEFSFLIAHNFKAVTATVLKSGKEILWLLGYTHWNFRIMPTSCMGVVIASIAWYCMRSKISHYHASLWNLTISGKNIATLSNARFLQQKGWDAYKPRIKPMALGIFEWWWLEKWSKFSVLHEMVPSLISYHICAIMTKWEHFLL